MTAVIRYTRISDQLATPVWVTESSFAQTGKTLPFPTTVFKYGRQYGWVRIAIAATDVAVLTRAGTEGGFENPPSVV